MGPRAGPGMAGTKDRQQEKSQVSRACGTSLLMESSSTCGSTCGTCSAKASKASFRLTQGSPMDATCSKRSELTPEREHWDPPTPDGQWFWHNGEYAWQDVSGDIYIWQSKDTWRCKITNRFHM